MVTVENLHILEFVYMEPAEMYKYLTGWPYKFSSCKIEVKFLSGAIEKMIGTV